MYNLISIILVVLIVLICFYANLFSLLLIKYSLHEKFCQRIVVYNIKYIQIYPHICTNQLHKYCILSIQHCEMRLYTLNLGFFILGFAIYPVAYGVGFTLLGLPIVKWISNFKQPIVSGQYFNVPKPTESV